VYFLDPDRHRLEGHIGSLESRLASLRESPYKGLELFPDADANESLRAIQLPRDAGGPAAGFGCQ
jgi:hypothetical protein